MTGGFSWPGSKEAGRPLSTASPPPGEGATGELDGASVCGVEGAEGVDGGGVDWDGNAGREGETETEGGEGGAEASKLQAVSAVAK